MLAFTIPSWYLPYDSNELTGEWELYHCYQLARKYDTLTEAVSHILHVSDFHSASINRSRKHLLVNQYLIKYFMLYIKVPS